MPGHLLGTTTERATQNAQVSDFRGCEQGVSRPWSRLLTLLTLLSWLLTH